MVTILLSYWYLVSEFCLCIHEKQWPLCFPLVVVIRFTDAYLMILRHTWFSWLQVVSLGFRSTSRNWTILPTKSSPMDMSWTLIIQDSRTLSTEPDERSLPTSPSITNSELCSKTNITIYTSSGKKLFLEVMWSDQKKVLLPISWKFWGH